jgi:hypothetical protein
MKIMVLVTSVGFEGWGFDDVMKIMVLVTSVGFEGWGFDDAMKIMVLVTSVGFEGWGFDIRVNSAWRPTFLILVYSIKICRLRLLLIRVKLLLINANTNNTCYHTPFTLEIIYQVAYHEYSEYSLHPSFVSFSTAAAVSSFNFSSCSPFVFAVAIECLSIVLGFCVCAPCVQCVLITLITLV